ncbi:MAG: type III-B CRISPR module RAMP protein Cmr4 [Alphaproteobacteria bacterium]|uniref:Type III-B CRISPR module RAMP protein Cmr4 n=1 Tax=Candidatus Nitrobium versatile TaxID=2884831 RepID=A0A953JE56_9BACT|nr:type III-B CRISPR module RAMP protein Cmr4 [Candidatus Nitrobium versatile]
MFTEKRAMFIYCISPVHMGAGTALDVIDNPIQRERHTGHPVMAGSGIKGAMRHAAEGNGIGNGMINKIFGPGADNSAEHAGAVSFSDGQIVLFPVRSLKEGFVYATCPTALARLSRLLDAAGIKHEVAATLNVREGECIAISDDVLVSGGKLVLEAYEYTNNDEKKGEIKVTAQWLSDNAIPDTSGFSFFKEKIAKHMVVLNDGEFVFFVKNATVIEPHVRIDDTSGTAADGGLFFTENLPPESLLVSLAMASSERMKKGADRKDDLRAPAIIKTVEESFNGKFLQIGGDSTTGRGQVFIKFAGGAQ